MTAPSATSDAVVLDPLDFIARLAALVPYPRQHLLTYHGLFEPAARGRERVVPGCWDDEEVAPRCRRGPGTQPEEEAAPAPSRYIPWAELLRRVLRMVESPAAVEQVLTQP